MYIYIYIYVCGHVSCSTVVQPICHKQPRKKAWVISDMFLVNIMDKIHHLKMDLLSSVQGIYFSSCHLSLTYTHVYIYM